MGRDLDRVRYVQPGLMEVGLLSPANTISLQTAVRGLMRAHQVDSIDHQLADTIDPQNMAALSGRELVDDNFIKQQQIGNRVIEYLRRQDH